MKFGFATAIALFAGGCATPPNGSLTAHAPIKEETFRAAARHCHSNWIIRMQPGVRNAFDVNGLIDPKTGRALGDEDIARIKCARHYLGIPKENVLIIET